MLSQEEKCLDTFYVVEATFDEQHLLWFRYSKDHDWQEESLGYWAQIGTLTILKKDGTEEVMPVAVNVHWVIINGKRVAFYSASSQLVDWRMVESWRDKEFPNRKGKCDVANFGHCLQATKT